MAPVHLHPVEPIDEVVPFSVRLAERRLRQPVATRAERRAHRRRCASELDWLRSVRLTGGMSCDIRLIDLSEGGALIEVAAPLRPGLMLTLEISGADLEIAVPLQVLRSYIASLSGDVTKYRGGCVFAHLIDLPERQANRPAGAAVFVGTDAALGYLLERCAASEGPASLTSPEPGVTLRRADILQVLDSLRARQAADQDPQNRYAAELFNAILPELRRGASQRAVIAALERRARLLPEQWQLRLAHTRRKLTALIEHCLPLEESTTPVPDRHGEAKDESAEHTSFPQIEGRALR